METAYLSHELSAGSNQASKGACSGLTPVETVDEVDKGVANQIPSKPLEPGSNFVSEKSKEESDSSTKEERVKVSNMKTTKKKFPFTKEQVDGAVQRTQEIVIKLHNCSDFTSNTCTEELEFLRQLVMLPSEYRHMQQMCYDAMVESDITSLFIAVMEQNLNLPFDQPEYKTSYFNMRAICVVHWNGTDASAKICEQIFKKNIYVKILSYLKSSALSSDGLDSTPKIYCVKALLGILHNLCQKSTKARGLLRESDAVNIVKVYKNSKNDMISAKALMVLAHIINEEENEMINSDEKAIQFMLTILQDSLKSKEHHSKRYGYRTTEIMEVLNRLAVIDTNKVKLVKHGALKCYATLLETSCSLAEQELSAKGLWTLAFKTKHDILADENCMKGLNHLVKHSKDKNVLSQAKGALWILEGQGPEQVNKNKSGSSNVLGAIQEKTAGSHIMISYQWDNKSTMIRIKDHLKEHGYKVWMDEDDMEGNILDGMAEAVENARAVLVCMSQKYKDSPNCRTEAEYAYKLRKKIVPLKLQYKYDPDGWLGIIVGTKLYFDFSEEYRYDKSSTNLLKELAERRQSSSTYELQPVTPAYMPDSKTIVPTPILTPNMEIQKWDHGKVMSWLEENSLAKYKGRFAEFDGTLLVEYKLMMASAPDFFFTTLRDIMKLPLADILRFSSSLRKI